MKLSIITTTYNSAKTISDTLKSVKNQSYPEIEHIIIDGASKDNTLKIVSEFPHVVKVISEPDKGIYDAMNKGIRVASGDVVGILNSDDFFTSNDVISSVVEAFQKNNIDSVIGDIQFVNPDNLEKVVRYYSSEAWHPKRFRYGFMPAHPSFYVKRKFYETLGLYETSYQIASDYDLLIRFLYKNGISYKYLNFPFVTMRTGGISNESFFYSRYLLNKEIVQACKKYGIKTNMALLSLKYFQKLFEYKVS